jgi:UDP:flavonoid glycosyltransferase YjiC (YdhE family)
MGSILKEAGHDVFYAFPEQYKKLVPENCPFFPFSASFLELIEGKEGKIVMGGKAGLLPKIRALTYLYRQGKKVNQLLVRQQYEITRQVQPDKIIHNAKCSYPTLWTLHSGREAIQLSPVPYFMYYVEGHAHVGFRGNLGIWLNRLTYRLANFGLVKTIRDAQKSLPDIRRFTPQEIREELFSKKLMYAISPSLFRRPAGWPAHVQVTGYIEKKQDTLWQPEAPLRAFLDTHPKVLLLTFGSMVNQEPDATSRLIYSVLRELEIPTVVNTASGGLLKLEEYAQDPLFCFVQSLPYERVLPRMYAVMHHGGSGTTHLALRYGCATLILPHIIDQFAWNALVNEMGAGPKGIALSKISRSQLLVLVRDLMLNPAYKHNAMLISEKMRRERGEDETRRFILDA